MAKIRVRWRHIFRNIGKVIILVQVLMSTWPEVRKRIAAIVEDDDAVQSFFWAADDLYQTIIRRRK